MATWPSEHPRLYLVFAQVIQVQAVYKITEDGEILSFMFMTVRQADGTWTEPVELQGDLRMGICPMITPDGQYLFFSSGGNLYWVNAEALEPFRQQ